ncbi:MAG: class I adenylate-forming enzyme family protein, partial [Actinomycetes bacterium]
TSGTTGRPKGAIHTHRNVGALLGLTFFHGLRNLLHDPPAADAGPSVQLVSSPLFHVSGLHTGAVAFLVGGVKSVWTMGRFDPVVIMRLIQRERATHWSFTPTMLHRVITHPEFGNFDLSSIRSGGGGGATFSPALIRAAKTAMPQLSTSMGVGYGLTECTALATLNSGAELDAFPTAVGRPLPTVEIEIRDEDGRVLPDGEEGDIHVRGPNVMLGYWNKPEETAASILPGRWLRTGDVGRIEGGRLHLASRKRDLIIRGGENVYPVEIEQRLEDHPAVHEVAVVGVPHDDLGQEVKAVCVLAAGHTATAEELTAWCADALAYFKVPAHFEFRTEPLPRNATGKVLKHVLTDAGASDFVEED